MWERRKQEGVKCFFVFFHCRSGKSKINSHRRICDREQTCGKHCNVDPFSTVTGSSLLYTMERFRASISFSWRTLKVLRSLFGRELSLPRPVRQSKPEMCCDFKSMSWVRILDSQHGSGNYLKKYLNQQ